MTKQHIDKEKSRHPFSGILLLIGTFGVFICLLFNTDIAIGSVRHGLDVCAKTVIPSLFPFMVLSGLLVELGTSDILAPIFAAPMKALFGISGAGAAAPIMGALCGFPVGSLAALKLYEKGKIGKEEFERLLVISNNPSSAFLISAVGTSLWSCPRFGVVLYAAQILSALTVGVIFRFLFPPIKVISEKNERVKIKQISFRKSLTQAVSDAAGSMIIVCAFVLFFAAVCGAMIGIIERFAPSRTIKSLIYGFFEMSGAVCEAAKVTPVKTGLILTAVICGWSGLSVHFQVMSLCHDRNVNFLPYICGKGLQSVISALLIILYIRFFDSSVIQMCVPAVAFKTESKISTYSLYIAAFFVLSAVFLIAKKIWDSRSSPNLR